MTSEGSPVTEGETPAIQEAPGETGVMQVGQELERLVGQLRRSYSAALAFARDLPMLGRCMVEVERPGQESKRTRRWVARLPARLYVETHIRSQLDHLVSCLQDEMMDPAKQQSLQKIVSSLEESAARLTSWKRIKALVLRLPPVAAALPVFVTAVADPLGDIESSELLDAGVVVLISALLAYGVAVWPSLRLGFRVKRAIFSGGVDLAHPFSAKPGTATWLGFRPPPRPATGDIVDDLVRWRARRHAPKGALADEVEDHLLLAFPRIDVYRDEKALFENLRRRKRQEVPIDLVLSLRPYLTTVFVAVLVTSYTSSLVGGGLVEDPGQVFLLPLVIVLSLVPAQIVWQLRANIWKRRAR